jgi:hypothetical protein
MRRFINPDPNFEVGHPIDSDPGQMTDDGCPLTPPRVPDQVEQYNLSSIAPWLAKTRYQRLREELELRGRWWSVCERMVERPDSKTQLERSAM